MRSIARVKSSNVTLSAPRLVASRAASLTRLARSAPVKPGVKAARSSTGMPSASFTLRRCTRRIEDFGSVGGGQEDDADRRVKAVEFGQQLVQRLLFLVMTAAEGIGPAGA